jgi:rhodanese-related sulfurtransferase
VAQDVKIRRLMDEDGQRVTINELLDAARRRLRRLDPNEARDAVVDGAVLVDIRSELQRERDGVIPGARFVPRNALEWRLDPASGHSDPTLDADLDRVVVLVCNEGYQSSLAAATLQDLGFRNATDLAGGFQAWRAAGLSVVSQPPR